MKILYLLCLLLFLTTLPGAWITFGIRLPELDWKIRLALGASLSPLVVETQLLILKFFSLAFDAAAQIVLAINLPCLYLIYRQVPTFRWKLSSKTAYFAVYLFLLLLSYLVIPWATIADYRTFAWHALLHTDLVYTLTHAPLLPEEPTMAGLQLAFAWIGHSFWGVLGWLSDWSPTVVYSFTNVTWLAITFFLFYQLVKTALDVTDADALAGTGLLFLGTNIIGAIAWLLTRNPNFLLGDIRYTPLLSKYLGFETMPFAFALLIGLALISIISLKRRIKFLPTIIIIQLIALGMLYPVYFPVGCLIIAVVIFITIIRISSNPPPYTRADIWYLSLGLCVSLVIFFVSWHFLTSEGARQLLTRSHLREVIEKGFYAFLALFPLALLACPYLYRSLLRRDAVSIFLLFMVCSLLGFHVIMHLGDMDYKYLLATAIFLTPLSAAGVKCYLTWQPRASSLVILFLMPLLLSIHLLLLFQMRDGNGQLPLSLANAPKVNQSSFWISLDDTEKDAGWTRAIRNLTPMDTIVVTPRSEIHIGSFVARTLYVFSDVDGSATAGYSMGVKYFLLNECGYPKNVYQERMQTVGSVFEESNPKQLVLLLSKLQRFNRPLAIRFPTDKAPFLTWMKQQGIGQELFSDGRNVVWYITDDSDKNQLKAVSLLYNQVNARKSFYE